MHTFDRVSEFLTASRQAWLETSVLCDLRHENRPILLHSKVAPHLHCLKCKATKPNGEMDDEKTGKQHERNLDSI